MKRSGEFGWIIPFLLGVISSSLFTVIDSSFLSIIVGFIFAFTASLVWDM